MAARGVAKFERFFLSASSSSCSHEKRGGHRPFFVTLSLSKGLAAKPPVLSFLEGPRATSASTGSAKATVLRQAQDDGVRLEQVPEVLVVDFVVVLHLLRLHEGAE
jgi:hypothetical protein